MAIGAGTAAAGTAAAGIAAAGIAGSMISSSKASKAAKAAAAQASAESGRQFDLSMKEMKKAAEYLESLGVPAVEAQRIALDYAQVGPSALEDVETDPRLKNAQMDALSKMQQLGEAGLTDEEKTQQMMMQRSVSGSTQARDKAVLQNMQERGIGGSGAELIARLQSSQSAADRGSLEQAQLSGQVQNRALQAISQAGQLGGQLRQQDYGEQAQAASASDRIAQFNSQNRAAAQQQQEIYNKQLIQQQFQNELSKRQSVASARTGTAQAGMQRAGQIQQAGTAAAQGEIQKGAAQSQLFGQLAGAGIKAFGKKDGGVIGTSEYREKQEYELGGVVGTPLQEFRAGGVAAMPMGPSESPNSNAGFAGGGIPVPESGMEEEERYLEGDVVPGDDFEGDRVDAKVNSGEMVLNIEQQQRLMELLKGLRSLKGLGDEDILESPNEGLEDIPQGMPPEMPQFDDGGMVPSEYKTETEAEPRGLHASLKHEKEQEVKQKDSDKLRKSRIKAMETLINGGR